MNSVLKERKRESIRLREHNYTAEGFYFVTICAKNRRNLFGKIKNDKVELSEIGKIVSEEWFQTSNIRENVLLDAFVIMPNHIHGIIQIQNNRNVAIDRGQSLRIREVQTVGIACNQSLQGHKFGPQYQNLFAIIRGFKASVTRRAIKELDFSGSVWQLRFYDHIIRDEDDLVKIREYILYNPQKWENDSENIFREKVSAHS